MYFPYAIRCARRDMRARACPATVRASAAVLVGVLLVSGLAACGGEPDTPEERVRAWLEAGEAAAEQRRLLALKEMISADYKDPGGRIRRDLTRLLAGYFHRHRSIHLLTQVETIAFPQPGRAQVVLYAAMAATPVEGPQSLKNMRADLHRFELDLTEEDGEWKLISAVWRRASTDDFMRLGGAEEIRGIIHYNVTNSGMSFTCRPTQLSGYRGCLNDIDQSFPGSAPG